MGPYQPFVIVDYDLTTGEIRQIISSSDGDSHPKFHPLNSLHGRVNIPGAHVSPDPQTGVPVRSGLLTCAKAVQQATGRWPPNVPQS